MYEVLRTGKFIETESKIEVSGTGGREGWRVSLIDAEILFGIMEKFWKWMVAMVEKYSECSCCELNYAPPHTHSYTEVLTSQCDSSCRRCLGEILGFEVLRVGPSR